MMEQLSLEQETLEKERQELQLQQQRLQEKADEHRQVMKRQQPQPGAGMHQEPPLPTDDHALAPEAARDPASAACRVECGKKLSTNSTHSTRVVSVPSHGSSQACGKVPSTNSTNSTHNAGAEVDEVDEVEEHQQHPRTASRGSAGHPDQCAKACKFVSTKRGCKDGADCDHCHLCTWRCQLRVRRRPAKRA